LLRCERFRLASPCRYNVHVTRYVLIAGLILLAAFLPLAVLPLAIFVLVSPLVLAGAVPAVRESSRPVTVLTLEYLRAPPSR